MENIETNESVVVNRCGIYVVHFHFMGYVINSEWIGECGEALVDNMSVLVGLECGCSGTREYLFCEQHRCVDLYVLLIRDVIIICANRELVIHGIPGRLNSSELKRQRRPSVKVSEAAAASSNGTPETSRRRRKKKARGEDANSRRSAVTTTRLVGRIWEEYFSSSSETTGKGKKKKKPARSKKVAEKWMPYYQSPRKQAGTNSRNEVSWIAGATGVTSDDDGGGNALYYGGVSINGVLVSPGSVVLVNQPRRGRDSYICLVEYMFQSSDGTKVVHGRVMVGAFETVLGNNADKRDLCLTEDCLNFYPSDVTKLLDVKIQPKPWSHQHRNRTEEKEDPETKYFCKNLYCSDKGGFFSLKTESIGLGNGHCHSCKTRKSQEEKNTFSYCVPTNSFTYQGIHYEALDFLYINPSHFVEFKNGDQSVNEDDEDSRPKAYAICQFVSVDTTTSSSSAQLNPDTMNITVRRFYRPEDLNAMDAYLSDIHTIYWSDKTATVPVSVVKGKCEVWTKKDFVFMEFPYMNEHTFFCEYVVADPDHRPKLQPLFEGCLQLKETRRKTEEEKEDESGSKCGVPRGPLATLDIFSGCGGLSEGLEKSGAAVTKWAIEFDQKAAEAFKLNHPDAFTLVQDCNVVLRDVMMANGDADDCIPFTEASSTSSASKLNDGVLSHLPKPGDVDFIVAGPPCQGFSVLNRYKKNSLSDEKRTMILSFLSYVDYFRPKYVLLENVRNLVSFDKMNPFQLTLKSFLEMGYQVRFGVLDAGFYGVAQSRKRVFIWAAAPEETLPEWPAPMHAFPTRELRIKLDLNANSHYTAVQSARDGVPLRALTVRDTIGDLPPLTDGDSIGTMPYKGNPVSWFQKRIRGNQSVLNDHTTKKLTEINLIQCLYLSPGEDWRNLPDKKINLSSNGKLEDLKPNWLVNSRGKGYQSKGVLGRLHWNKNFPTAITNPQPRGKVGRWFHPVEHRMISVREYARSQGFPDSYQFVGTLRNKYQQVGNAVPPPLAYALGRKLKVAMEGNNS
ncbi:PREDICTED: DNA (cytosine-5)-methyltransferase 1-like [Ipomoea nil]|uniref:DNA (cytosine-5)-methyltransferase 1-like n=1 Tax=Ipomoea nil TaxID=35883 RepID=UPI000901F84C|nr:PREDICTED: DNA (cytosine-5)-methyltransferase 1-like [Ipomoea nil]